ncbi:MAG: hypothetical protein ACM3ZC_12415 [Bacteroidota bacterium]
MNVPDQIVSRVYVQRSLRNTPAGLAMSFRNLVRGGSIAGFSLTRLEIDGQKHEPDKVQLRMDGATASAATVGQRSVAVPYGATVEILLPGVTLPPGEHVVTFGAVTRESGELVVSVRDFIV